MHCMNCNFLEILVHVYTMPKKINRTKMPITPPMHSRENSDEIRKSVFVNRTKQACLQSRLIVIVIAFNTEREAKNVLLSSVPLL